MPYFVRLPLCYFVTILIFKCPCINYDLFCFPKERLSEVIECGAFCCFFLMMNISRVCLFLLKKALHLQQVLFLLYRKINTEKSWDKKHHLLFEPWEMQRSHSSSTGLREASYSSLVINVNLYLSWFTVCCSIVTASLLHAHREAMCTKHGYMNKINISISTAWVWALMNQIALQNLLRCFYSSKKGKITP